MTKEKRMIGSWGLENPPKRNQIFWVGQIFCHSPLVTQWVEVSGGSKRLMDAGKADGNKTEKDNKTKGIVSDSPSQQKDHQKSRC